MNKRQQNFRDLSSESENDEYQSNQEDSAPEDNQPQQDEIINELQNFEQLNELVVDQDEPDRKVYVGNIDSNQIQASSAAYNIYHKFGLEWPFLSLDFICVDDDTYSSSSENIYLIGGTQPAQNFKASVQLIRISNIQQRKKSHDEVEGGVESAGDESDEESSLSDLVEPIIERRAVDMPGDVCRIRSFTQYSSDAGMPVGNSRLAVCQLSTGAICFLDLSAQFKSLNVPNKGQLRGSGYFQEKYDIQIQDFQIHPTIQQFPQKSFGFGLGINPVHGLAVSGTRAGELLAYKLMPDGRVLRDPKDFGGFPTGEWIEEVCFGHCGGKMSSGFFAAAGTNGWLQLVDPRQSQAEKAEKVVGSDINALEFDYCNENLLYCGTESGEVLLFDLRGQRRPVVSLKQSKSPITSLKASPTSEASILAADDAGNAFIYQMDAEDDEELQKLGLPHQFLFLHAGLEEPREAIWAGTHDGLAVIADMNGLQLFKPIGW